MGGSLLKFVYQKCLMPFYAKICYPSDPQLRAHEIQTVRLEVAITILFDLLNVLCLTKEDSYR